MSLRSLKSILSSGLWFGAAIVIGLAASAATPPPWQTADGYRFRPLPHQPAAHSPGFSRLSPRETGIHFTNQLAESRSLTNHILLNGSGVALGDVDGDGWVDIFLAGLDGPNALYRNEGQWRFTDITDAAGLVTTHEDATGAAFADLDGDGDLDLLLNGRGIGTRCYHNDGHGRFIDRTAESGTASVAGSMSLALADVDDDGDLDLYVANYRVDTVRDRFSARLTMNRVNGQLVVTAYEGRPTTEPDLVGRFHVDAAGGLIENGQADVLFLNNGSGRFEPVPFTGGRFLDEDGQALREPLYDWSLSAMFRDLNRDGRPDLYVCSDMASSDRIWINQGAGRFRALRREAIRKTSWFSMGIDFGDLDRDGLDDFFVTDMVSREHRLRQIQVSNHQLVPSKPGVFDQRPQAPRNTLFFNLGDGDFTEAAFHAGLAASEWSWAPVFLDVDLDGFEDVLVVTGFERDVQDIDVANELEAARQSRRLSDAEALTMRRRFPSLHQANLAFRNRGDRTFEETGAAWGFNHVGISQGMALADLDNDGDLDVVVNNQNDAAGIYRNESTAPRVAVRLRGQTPNTAGIGSRIRLVQGTLPDQSQEVIAGGRYLSSDDPLRVFAAGSTPSSLRLEVEWRSGRQSILTKVQPNHLYEIQESTQSPTPHPTPSAPEPAPSWFEDVTDRLAHRAVENDFDDFARQPLLPRKLGQAGPSIAWHDLDQDGWPDLVIGTGRGGPIGLRRNDRRGGFVPWTNALTRTIARDLGGLAIWEAEGSSRIITAFSNYEGAAGEPASVKLLDLVAGSVSDAVPPDASDPGPLALADIDADGDLDLFVGGRLIPGRYPEPATSRLFRRTPEGWITDTNNSALFQSLGLVNGAVFTDWNADGLPDLVLACDWGPLRLFQNNGAAGWAETTRELGFEDKHGWWQGVTAGDFDGDGRLDLLASNWGTNTRHAPQRSHPFHLYYGDLNGAGQVDLLEAYFDPSLRKMVPWHHLGRVRPALPFVQERFGNFHDFATASIEQIAGDRAGSLKHLSVNWMESTLFLRRGDRFEPQALPGPAQLAPAFAVCVADFNGDGHEDAFLSQNFFATDPEVDRHDGGRGLLLRGRGDGTLTPVLATESGLRVYGEQRAAAVADFDRDGRPDLAVSQNGQVTRLFRNQQARPGLRIRLQGPPGNPYAVGATLRLQSNGKLGPARELHAGSGYLSQDEPIAILTAPGTPESVFVRWPGGRETRSPIPSSSRFVRIHSDGRLESLDPPP
ncbi:MAG: VCBS repeat-containing protein [Verrucomicrobiales bacterium]|nr:VCBS repeat-containing protein [Verrucomicrobiales bacterium]